jgi:hypothetical protein
LTVFIKTRLYQCSSVVKLLEKRFLTIFVRLTHFVVKLNLICK